MEYTTTQNSNWQFNPLSLYITTFIIDVQNCKLIISCTTLSFSLSQKTHLLIQFLSKSQRQTITYSILFTANTQKIWYSDSIATRARSRAGHCVCLCRREREREREMENPRMLSLFLCFGFLGLCHAIESPQYTVVHSESDFEIRLYRQSTWMSAPAKDISFEKATKFGFHRYYYFFLKPCWFWVILGTLFFVWWENEGKQNRNQSKVLGFSLGLCLFFCFLFWGLICSAESDISGWFYRSEISSFWLVAEKL